MVGSLTGVVAFQNVTKACKGKLNLVNHLFVNAMVKVCLTEKSTNFSDTQVGHSDPIILHGKIIA